jgi:hypothetical protein
MPTDGTKDEQAHANIFYSQLATFSSRKGGPTKASKPGQMRQLEPKNIQDMQGS